MEKKTIKFLSSHGIVEGKEFDSVSLTFGMSKKNLPHTPVMSGGGMQNHNNHVRPRHRGNCQR